MEFFPIAGNDKEKAIDFIDANPVLYRKMVVGSLTPFCNNVAGIIFASDCAPPMRIISHVCRELDIPRILIPYESAPLDDGVYYRDARTLVSFPSADVVLGWDDRQKEVFTKRGYPEAQFLSVGSLSLDEYVNYDARLSRQQFSRLFGLEPEKKIILLVIQSLMLSSRTGAAFAAQKDAVLDMVELSRLLGMQLLIRLPRFADNVMDSDMLAVLNDADHVATDDSTFCMVSFEEAVFHSDFVSSIGGGGVAEAKLMGKATLSLEYFDFTRNWASVDTAVVRNRSELAESLDKFLSYESLCEVEEVGNSTALLTPDCADGLASSRIQALLKENAFGGDLWAKPRGPFELMLKKQAIDVVAIPSSKAVLESVQVYVKDMLVANSLISSKGDINTIADLVAVDVFVQWGISDSKSKKHQRSIAKQLGRKVVYIEDGFIRSSSIGLSGEAGLSLVIDDLTAHYDAVRPSRMELILQHGPVIDDAGKQRASDAIELIKNTRISKYNHAPDVEVSIGSPSRRKILVVDQRYGDQSVVSGLGSVQVFRQMLEDAVADNPDADILVKRHPDAIGGSKSSYYSDENISAEMCADNIYLIDFDVNPFRLLELASDVYVVTSGMGFEALMAGKTVHCYGVPFYSGWGLTKDRVSLDRRSRVRSLEEIFYVSYIQLSRYYSPVLGRACELEDILDYFSLVGRQCAFSEKCTSLYA
ncbi:hypothetical protein [Salinicola tamaricis]|uniref:capsular polysaccharide export protein, LipB/KpsS family n=1 Tax=Salinicola tamaricis TaxID=1771309 RepID=UPI000D09C9B4|nr:hypothetical protein [Salinicola tamaricis]